MSTKKNKLVNIIMTASFAFAVGLGLIAPVVLSQPVGALGARIGAEEAKGDEQKDDVQASFRDITNILLYIVGAVSVIMLVIGGIRYTISNGDQGAIKGAKDTILYAVIGIIVALLAFAIVNFVLTGIGV